MRSVIWSTQHHLPWSNLSFSNQFRCCFYDLGNNAGCETRANLIIPGIADNTIISFCNTPDSHDDNPYPITYYVVFYISISCSDAVNNPKRKASFCADQKIPRNRILTNSFDSANPFRWTRLLVITVRCVIDVAGWGAITCAWKFNGWWITALDNHSSNWPTICPVDEKSVYLGRVTGNMRPIWRLGFTVESVSDSQYVFIEMAAIAVSSDLVMTHAVTSIDLFHRFCLDWMLPRTVLNFLTLYSVL